jgi:hypothetical protein
MNILRGFKNKSPEELAEKSRKEKEWAEKCYRAGERFAEKYRLDTKVQKINEFGSKYPKTFFLILFGMIFGCAILNFTIATGSSFIKGQLESAEEISLPEDKGKEIIRNEIKELYVEMDALSKSIEKKLAADTITHQDSVDIVKMMNRMTVLNDIITNKEAEDESTK